MNTALLQFWHRMLRHVGRYRLAALALLLLSLLLSVWTLQLDAQSDALRATISAKRAAHPLATAPATRHMTIAEQVDEFVAAFPPVEQSAADLEQVFQSARQHKLELPRGEYKFKQGLNEPLVSYTAVFPVKAEYGVLRDFSADVLRALPHASMDELRMSRSSADSTRLEAVMRFTLVYRR